MHVSKCAIWIHKNAKQIGLILYILSATCLLLFYINVMGIFSCQYTCIFSLPLTPDILLYECTMFKTHNSLKRIFHPQQHCYFFKNTVHPNEYEVIFHCGFDLHFPIILEKPTILLSCVSALLYHRTLHFEYFRVFLHMKQFSVIPGGCPTI